MYMIKTCYNSSKLSYELTLRCLSFENLLRCVKHSEEVVSLVDLRENMSLSSRIKSFWRSAGRILKISVNIPLRLEAVYGVRDVIWTFLRDSRVIREMNCASIWMCSSHVI